MPLRWWILDCAKEPRLSSTPSRTLDSSAGYTPFGQLYDKTGSDYSFTGDTSLLASGLYDFPLRRLSTSQGRWISPDPAGVSAVDPANPQSWNRYAYALNNPLALIDPLGLDGCPPPSEDGQGSGCDDDGCPPDVTCFYDGPGDGSTPDPNDPTGQDPDQGPPPDPNQAPIPLPIIIYMPGVGTPLEDIPIEGSTATIEVLTPFEVTQLFVGAGFSGFIGGAAPSDVQPVAASPVYHCTSAGALPGGICPYGCNQMVSSFSAATVVTQSEEQAACPPPRQGCAMSIEVIFTGQYPIQPLPKLKFYKAQIVPNSCIYGRPN